MSLLIIVVALAVVFDFINGFHDAANSIATIVTTKVLTPFQAVLWAASWNFFAYFVAKHIIGEFGYEWDWSLNFDDFADGMDRDFRRGLWYGLFSPTPVTPMSWWWEYFENRNMMPYFRGVREISDRMLAAGNGAFEEVRADCAPLEAMSVKCGGTIFVYLYNNSARQVRRADLTVEAGIDGAYTVECLDPQKFVWAEAVKGRSGEVRIDNLAIEPYGERIYQFTPEKQ